MKLLVLDFGGTFVKHGIVDEEGNVSDVSRSPAPSHSLDEFFGFVEDIAERYRTMISGIAISLPGIIDTEKGHVYVSGCYTEIIRDMDLADELSKRTGLRVTIENDGKSAGLAEFWKGKLKGVKNGLSFVIGSGVGCSMIIDGKLTKGSHFTAGEISAVMYRPGKYGFENFVPLISMSDFLRAVATAKNMDPSEFEIAGEVSAQKKQISGQEVFEWIEKGDEDVLPVYQNWLSHIAWLIYNTKTVVDPDRIVIGGGVSRNDRFISDLRESYEKYTEPFKLFERNPVTVERCTFASDANLVGAAYVWFQRFSHIED